MRQHGHTARVTVRIVPIETLVPDPDNARMHTPRSIDAIQESIHAVGAARSGVVTEDGKILAGNGMHEAAMLAGLREAIVVDTDGDRPVFVRRRGLTRAQQVRLALDDNRAQELSAFDPAVVARLVEEVPSARAGWSDIEWADVLKQITNEPKAGLTDPDAVPNERHTDIQVGDVFALNGHRLVCGDSRQMAAVEAVMARALADGMWTDPPFGVSYVGKTSDALVLHGDEESDLAPLLRDAFAAADRVLKPGAAIYVAHPPGRNAVVFGAAFLAVGWHFHQGLVWIKDSLVFGHSDFHYQHEGIIYGWKTGAPRTWLSDRTQVTVFAIDRPKASPDHPTSKPVELVIRQIGNNVPNGGVIFEPFCGSGTTLIAAEQLGLSCRAMELSPVYCQVSIDRWAAFVGNGAKAVKVGETVR